VDGRRVEDTGNDVELTLRVGQTVPVDIQPWAAHPGQSCGTNQAVVSVGVGPPPQEMDRQLVVTELWLIDKTPSGAEQTQRLTLRGRYGEIQRFYFDDIDGPDRSLDLSGDVLALAREDGVELQIATQRRRTSYDGNVRDYATAITRLRLRPTDTAAVELPKAEAVRDPFHGHTLSLRIQSREVRPAIGAQPASALSGPRAK
jgi:hypothetical protein